jgi:hypothetical protein
MRHLLKQSIRSMTGKEAIVCVGKIIEPDFSIDSEELENAYKAVYGAFVQGVYEGARSKGVMLIGAVGCGKTVCSKIMHRLFRDSNSRFLYKRGAEINDLIETMPLAEIKQIFGVGLKCDLYIDDFGVNDADGKKYGNTISVMGELIFDRYELFVNEGYRTHISTNLLPESINPEYRTIRKVFGDRVYDRISQMTTPIVFTNKSLRK